ncbi:antibiotic ABC transporter ATP-binding protein [Mangrovimonas yunxiaonensis]|uniref:Antibiotic ABC transporter ATP-binding protein n=1 Tax=Mangrovimonas yunxiaonensis TaxID=1197477 RepID=A0A084TNG4_9FLAO|nr:ABC transporter ATP-binding protein [Mangrovimonas yunxiaonensis]KFB02250.1 antibiotic ABC transporter ATP-binding protein [Mangrovimonas yunxiaonensis]GGH39211.1 antibiotic ABC transporter ATP-binding protein [Mangrovimonas yunxiaonensis]
MKKIINQLLPFIKKFKRHVFFNVLFNLLYAFFSALAFISLIPMLNVLFDKTTAVKEPPTWEGIFKIKAYGEQLLNYKVSSYLENGNAQMALVIAIVIVISTFLLKNMFGYFAMQHVMYLKNGVLTDLRKTMYNKIIGLPISFYSKRQKGDVMARILGDINEMQNSFFIILELIVREPATIIFSLIMMFTISWELSLFVLCFIPVAGFLISRIGKSLKKNSLKAQQESGRLISIVEETLTGLKIIKSYNAEGIFKSSFITSADKILKLRNKIGLKNNLAGPVSEVLGIATIAILLWYGGKLVLVDKVIEGTVFLPFMGLAYGILTPAKAISKASYKVKNGMAAADRVFDILHEENSMPDLPNATTLERFNHNISIENISFKYDEDYVLKNFSVEVPKGKTIALVGQSGSGKSTIANLVTRFYDVNEGRISIDGTNIKNITKHSLRNLMGLVTQDSILFNESIKNNILLGKPDATDQDIIEALKIANAWEFVKDLPQGIETNIGDSGNKLSGGQKQRLSIARAVLKNPPIMILDEATSALDTESERLVQDALENMMRNRTSIVIAHRLSTIQNADTIVVMQKGKIVEQGTHTALMAENGVYKKLVDMQSFE